MHYYRFKMNPLYQAMLARRNPSQVEGLMRFFKTGPGQYGEGDKFLGIKVPETRAVVKEQWRKVSFAEVEECLASEYHEVRLAALLMLVEIFSHAKKDPDLQRQCVESYLSHKSAINNWDLVDLSCYPLLGVWLLDKDRTLLYDLARSGKTLWEQRIGMVSTMTFIRHGQLDDTFAIADILLHHPHDLIHKAVGWLLREAGKRDKAALEAFLRPRYRTMPRTMLRYTIEKFPEAERLEWLSKERIRSRPWLDGDAPVLFKYASDPEVGPRAGWPPHKSVEESLEIIRTVFNDATCTWAIEWKETGEAIGAMGYGPSCQCNLPAREGEPLIGYWVARPYWNQGICTEALRLMLDRIRKTTEIKSLISGHFIDNPASGRVMEKCGFFPTGETVVDPEQGRDTPIRVLRLEL